MQCPLKIVKNGNSPQGNILMIQFDKSNYPAKVQVEVGGVKTTDIDEPNGKSGVWTSRDKYSSPEVVLILLDSAGTVLSRCKYGLDGTIKQEKGCQIDGFIAEFNSVEAKCVVKWKSTLESELKSYIVEKNEGQGFVDPRLTFPTGAGSSYSVEYQDLFEDKSTYVFKLTAVFNDSSTSDLGTPRIA